MYSISLLVEIKHRIPTSVIYLVQVDLLGQKERKEKRKMSSCSVNAIRPRRRTISTIQNSFKRFWKHYYPVRIYYSHLQPILLYQPDNRCRFSDGYRQVARARARARIAVNMAAVRSATYRPSSVLSIFFCDRSLPLTYITRLNRYYS